MLSIKKYVDEQWDEINEKFILGKNIDIDFEYSLDAISKWESKYCKPFLTCGEKTAEELLYLIECMIVDEKLTKYVVYLNNDDMDTIGNYISRSQSAATFEDDEAGITQHITSETMWWWIIECGLPQEASKWHLSRLISLVTTISRRRNPPKKVSETDTAIKWAMMNERRLREGR